MSVRPVDVDQLSFPRRPGIDIASIDLIRGIAAIYVLVNHTRGAFFAGGERMVAAAGPDGLSIFETLGLALLQLTSIGEEFVIVFFVVSGFSMAHSVGGTAGIRSFYAKRLVRIWPPYVIAVFLAFLICGAVAFLDPGNELARIFEIKYLSPTWLVAHLTYVDVWSPLTPQFWSLPYEVMFYALSPLLLLNRSRVVQVAISATLLFIVGILFYGLALNPASSKVINFVTGGLFYFMCGSLLYYFRSYVPLISLRTFVVVLGAGLLAAICIRYVVGYSSAPVNTLMVALTALTIANLPKYQLNLGPFNFGFMSYSIYIFHYQLIVAIKFAMGHFFGIEQFEIFNVFAWMIAIPPIMFVCWLLYLVSERPCNMHLSNIRKKQDGIALAVGKPA